MSKERVPIREGYFTEEKEGGLLVGSKCKSCGQVYFPPMKRCFECYSKDIENITLSKTGKLYTYAIVQVPMPHFKPPLALAWVEFPEGVRVFSQVTGWEGTNLKIGMDMQVVIDTLWEEEEKEIYGYKFKPAA
jgi:uncharacterized OB-fold protein